LPLTCNVPFGSCMAPALWPLLHDPSWGYVHSTPKPLEVNSFRVESLICHLSI